MKMQENSFTCNYPSITPGETINSTRGNRLTLLQEFTMSPASQVECYYLRLFLHEACDPKPFQDMRRVNGHVIETYRQVC
uniref:Uncharacterized protein n=1 Tax=Octopus bimaculoides TaxID=37653 RepID=A0A0L8HWU4_OCTBM